MIKFKSLNENAKFLEILKKRKINTKYFTIYFSKNSKKTIDEFNQCLIISFVMKKKVGNSVVRNKIKRKLKHATQKILNEKQQINLNYTYVIFGKNNVYKDKFVNVLEELNKTFNRIKQMDS